MFRSSLCFLKKANLGFICYSRGGLAHVSKKSSDNSTSPSDARGFCPNSASLLCQTYPRTLVALLICVSCWQLRCLLQSVMHTDLSVISIWTNRHVYRGGSVSLSAWFSLFNITLFLLLHCLVLHNSDNPAFLFCELNESMPVLYLVAIIASIKQDQFQQCCRKTIPPLSDNY